MTAEIPPYQGIDLLTGAPQKAVKEPVAGYVITFADIGCIGMFESEAEADAAAARAESKYSAQKFRCWIHTQDNNRKYWSPR